MYICIYVYTNLQLIMKKALIFLFVSSFIYVKGQNPLTIPATLTGPNISLTLQNGTTQFYPPMVTNTMGANGSLLGPTLILEKDSFVNITVNNQLNDTTTIHWHGMHVAPVNDGGPHSVIPPGTTGTPNSPLWIKLVLTGIIHIYICKQINTYQKE